MHMFYPLCGRKNSFSLRNPKVKEESTAQRIPRWLPTKVLTLPNSASEIIRQDRLVIKMGVVIVHLSV